MSVFTPSGSGGGGTGNVTGPNSSTDNAVVRWDGTTGKFIQNSTAILNDDGVLSALALLQKNNIPTGVTVSVQSNDIYIVGDELNIEGTLEMGGTLILV